MKWIRRASSPVDESNSQPGEASSLPKRQSIMGVVARRIRDGVITLLIVVTVIFTLAHVVGNPALAYAPIDASDEEVALIERQFGLDRPFTERYVEYLGDLVTGDFGDSNWQKRPALDAVREAIPATIQLTLAGILVASVFGAAGGLLAGVSPNSAFDRMANFFSVSALSVPNFWLGLLLIVVFAVNLGWFPTSGRYGWSSIVLPAVTLGIVHGGRIFQLVRSATVEEISKPYVMVARSKGFSMPVVVGRHVLRNTGLTMATTVGWEYVRMWGGAAFAIEYVFAWPGVGLLMINGANRQDFYVLQCAVIIAGAFVIVSNLLIDLFYNLIDRRIQGAG